MHNQPFRGTIKNILITKTRVPGVLPNAVATVCTRCALHMPKPDPQYLMLESYWKEGCCTLVYVEWLLPVCAFIHKSNMIVGSCIWWVFNTEYLSQCHLNASSINSPPWSYIKQRGHGYLVSRVYMLLCISNKIVSSTWINYWIWGSINACACIEFFILTFTV